jgi:hypothetical protein
VKNYVNEKRLAAFRRKKRMGWGLLHLTGDETMRKKKEKRKKKK